MDDTRGLVGGKKERNTGANGAGFERREDGKIKEKRKCVFIFFALSGVAASLLCGEKKIPNSKC